MGSLAVNLLKRIPFVMRLITTVQEPLGGPSARILISLYQMLKPLGDTFEIR